MQYTVQYTIYTVGHTRELCPVVPRCGLKSIGPQLPTGLTHTATGAIMIAPVPDESPRWRRCINSSIGHFYQNETNHDQHRLHIHHSNQVPPLTLRRSTRSTATPPLMQNLSTRIRCRKVPHKDLNQGDDLAVITRINDFGHTALLDLLQWTQQHFVRTILQYHCTFYPNSFEIILHYVTSIYHAFI